MSTAYDSVASGKGSINWQLLTEEERYGIWSLHLERGGKFLDYTEFCDTMDEATR